MTLESKAKTLFELYSEGQRVYDINTKIKYSDRAEITQSKWIPFEEVKKIEDKVNNFRMWLEGLGTQDFNRREPEFYLKKFNECFSQEPTEKQK
jgi:hypothetical protein